MRFNDWDASRSPPIFSFHATFRTPWSSTRVPRNDERDTQREKEINLAKSGGRKSRVEKAEISRSGKSKRDIFSGVVKIGKKLNFARRVRQRIAVARRKEVVGLEFIYRRTLCAPWLLYSRGVCVGTNISDGIVFFESAGLAAVKKSLRFPWREETISGPKSRG